MNIVHVIWSLGTGGTETMLADIVSEQVITNEVSVVVINDVVDTGVLNRIDSRCKVYFCKRKNGSRNPIPLLKFNWLLWKLSPQVIHAHMDNLGKIIKIRRNAKVVRTIHCAFGNSVDHSRYDKLFAISEGVKKFVASQGFDSCVIYNGIHPEMIASNCFKKAENDFFRIVNVGRLQEVKGQHVLIEAAKILKDQGFNNFKIDFIGDGENRDHLLEIVEKKRLKQTVSFLGLKTRDFIYANLCKYDLYVQPSLSEGFGLTLSEAMAAGVPVITSDQDGPVEVVAGGKYGLVFKTGDAADLAERIRKIITRECRLDVVGARRYVCSNFDIKITARRYLEEYQKIIKLKNTVKRKA